ncbi:DUF2971 domain-containing protein [Rhodococcus aetherivorans]|uniref:DUF2971 domain-containing protein n=1 Tax=Rhodococcus aetherivorans TaxID=191292 RepID=UPI001E37C422|nr:DUF2971 domain-containing protein [Rhodococcus aetherivorans]UGQ39385.1 DUF2971 domain-containing protein [Rhodococcus aetherivorans]
MIPPNHTPDVLYHYTDPRGLLGILGDPYSPPRASRKRTYGKLWATDLRFLNDAQELKFAAPILTEMLRHQADHSSLPPAVVERLRHLADVVEEGRFELAWHEKAKEAWPHVVCFCEDGDLLSQWRGYGDGGGGYSIGFSREAVSSLFTADKLRIENEKDFDLARSPVSPPMKVAYGEEDARDTLEKAVQEFTDGLVSVEEGDTKLSQDTFVLVCQTYLAAVKHEAFEEECEWRVIVDRDGTDHPEFRTGKLGLVPYAEVLFPIGESATSPVREVVVGPSDSEEVRDLRAQAVRRLLDSVGLTSAEVRLSDAPFRG